jgi:2-keto-3-deoxy-6-phosphogluconate aldolase
MKLLTPTVRLYLYGVISAALPLLVTAGIMAPEEMKDWLFLAAAILGLGSNVMAASNVNQKPSTDVQPSVSTVPLFIEQK